MIKKINKLFYSKSLPGLRCNIKGEEFLYLETLHWRAFRLKQFSAQIFNRIVFFFRSPGHCMLFNHLIISLF